MTRFYPRVECYAHSMLGLPKIFLSIVLLAGCAATHVTFPNATPGKALPVPADEYRPRGDGPFPGVVLLHGCGGVSPSTHQWARWFRAQGYVALVVDSWTPRGFSDLCPVTAPDPPATERFDDAIGALAFLQSRSYVDRNHVGAIGWSNGGVYALAVINGPSLERARRRGVTIPEPGFVAAIGVYPGGCVSLASELSVRPALLLIGDADDWIQPGPCVDLVVSQRARGADVTIVLYHGAYHYFDVEGQPHTQLVDVANDNRPNGCCGATVAYDSEAAADAFRRVSAFFGRHLAPR
jgi:dienelactone hydrolase